VAEFESEDAAKRAFSSMNGVPQPSNDETVAHGMVGKRLFCDYARWEGRHDHIPNVPGYAALSSTRDKIEVGQLPVPGLRMVLNFVSPQEEAVIMNELGGHAWLETIKTRQTQHFGYEFDYKVRHCHADQPLGPLPHWAASICERIADECSVPIADQLVRWAWCACLSVCGWWWWSW
jgi:hypothetical protein